MSPGSQRIVFVSGMSGSGKSTAMAALEDLSFYCVDNLPIQLIPQFLALCTKASAPIQKIALALDAREKKFLEHLPETIAELRRQGAQVDVIFLDCTDEALERRYRETRRVHPHSPGGSVHDGIALERSLLDDVVRLADLRVDTTLMNVHQLKEIIVRHVSGATRRTVVNVISFGFRHGTPSAVELLFDVRFLPNPYFDEILRPGSGLESPVAGYVLESERGAAFLEKLRNFVSYLLPFYDEEGKAYVTLGIGCTGGRHRSVAVAEAIAASLRDSGRDVTVTHRDLEKAL